MSTLPASTPTRALLTRLRRRSSLASGSSDTSSPLAFVPSSIAEEDIDDEEKDFAQLEQQVEQLLLESKEKDLEVERLRGQLSSRKNTTVKGRPSDMAEASSSNGLTWEAARKLEREFEAQEMILKGLQRDNEAKTLEVEQLRRQMRTMSEFLTRQCGHEWEEVVFGSGPSNGQQQGSSKVTGLPSDLNDDPLLSPSSHISQILSGNAKPTAGPATTATPTRRSSPLKRMAFLNQDDEGYDTTVDEASFSSAAPSPAPAQQGADDSFEAYILESKSKIQPKGAARNPATTQSTSADNAALLAQLDATRMLIQGFARRNARRGQELKELEDRARKEMEMGREFASSGKASAEA